MSFFSLEEIVRKLDVSPKELRELALKLEKENSDRKPISEKERLYNEYKQRLLNLRK